MDLLLHVVAVRAKRHRLITELRHVHRPLNRCATRVHYPITAGADLGAVAVLEVDHPPRHREERGNGGGSEVLAIADTEEERRAAARNAHRVGVARRDERERESALELADRAHGGGEKRRIALGMS